MPALTLSDETLRANIAARLSLTEAEFACFRRFIRPDSEKVAKLSRESQP